MTYNVFGGTLNPTLLQEGRLLNFNVCLCRHRDLKYVKLILNCGCVVLIAAEY